MSCLIFSSISHLFTCQSQRFCLFFWRLYYAVVVSGFQGSPLSFHGVFWCDSGCSCTNPSMGSHKNTCCPKVQCNIAPSLLSATALLQKATTLGAHSIGLVSSTTTQLDMGTMGQVITTTRAKSPEHSTFKIDNLATWQKYDGLTRDFLVLTGDQCSSGGRGNKNGKDLLSFIGGLEFSTYDRGHSQW
ncbi:Hypothetical predicted protein [Olea europaea subsp. europaea]|uniref:Uncharacterized protein n=1 Tax=Olea europaea subsp. europaea TaxID=158383 RepID=A0A8S0SVU8_OLEEU|nr:Hypothetical predicted protein [Olea europaea subsp. europaea]